METRTKVSLGTILMVLPLLPAIGVWHLIQYRIDQLEQDLKTSLSKADDRGLKLDSVIMNMNKIEVKLENVDGQLKALWRRASN